MCLPQDMTSTEDNLGENDIEGGSSTSASASSKSNRADDRGGVCDWLLSSVYLDEFKEQLNTSIPCMWSLILTKIPWFISLGYVGELGAKPLAAAALANTLCNVTGLSFSVGISSALTTLAGQARGNLMRQNATAKEKNNNQGQENQNDTLANDQTPLLAVGETSKRVQRKISLPLMFLFRGLFVQCLFVLPMGIWWLYGIQPTLLKLGQNVEISSMTEDYLRILTFALWTYSVNWTITVWLQVIEMSDVLAYATGIALVIYIPLNHLYIYTMGYGYLGAALATATYQTVQPIITITYLFFTEHGKKRVLQNAINIGVESPSHQSSVDKNAKITIPYRLELKHAVLSISGIKEYLSLALPGLVNISEWWASETAIFLSGKLFPNPEVALSAISIYQSMNGFCFMFPVSWSIAGSTRVSNLLGRGDIHRTDIAAKVSVFCAILCSVSLGALLYFVPHTFFPSLFHPDNSVIAETGKLVPLLSIYVIGDGIQCALSGIIKGCGRQCVSMPVVVIAYWVIGLPLAYYFAFVRGNASSLCEDNFFCGDVGLVSGMTIGTWAHMMMLFIVVITTTNWKLEAIKAKERLK